ncbi:hypothetical protein EVAR_39709_1 [Eumeta japonica]|uniref:Uncharacterized protein n=1 Tax=Eumeta variegata TaxID=151549 RepID=A0A4C1W711_EUMVA|nr:hypothetical protein EVAR_39709_1 [Eumeta japonica]
MNRSVNFIARPKGPTHQPAHQLSSPIPIAIYIPIGNGIPIRCRSRCRSRSSLGCCCCIPGDEKRKFKPLRVPEHPDGGLTSSSHIPVTSASASSSHVPN